MSETRDTYDQIAEDWHKDHQNDDWWIQGTENFISLLPKGAKVLDVGCGGGTKAKFLMQHGIAVTGIDFSAKLLDIAKREVPDATFQVMDMRDIAGLDQEFDGVFAQASLLHISRKEASGVLEGLVSKLKLGGYLYVAVKGKREGHADEEIKEETDYAYSYRRFFSYFSLEEIESFFTELKLTIVYTSTTTIGKTDWLQAVGRKGDT